MWVFRENLVNASYEIGYYQPDGKFYTAFTQTSIEWSMYWVSFLNGGAKPKP